MESLQTLLDNLKETRSLSSDAALARLVDVKPQTMSNWRKGHNLPDAVACARLSELSGVPLARVLGIVGEARAISREEKAVWRRLAAAAAMVLMVAAGGAALISYGDSQLAVFAAALPFQSIHYAYIVAVVALAGGLGILRWCAPSRRGVMVSSH